MYWFLQDAEFHKEGHKCAESVLSCCQPKAALCLNPEMLHYTFFALANTEAHTAPHDKDGVLLLAV